MKVKIINPRAWYSHKLGEIVEVEDDKDNLRYYKLKNYSNSILKSDTIPVNELKYEKSEHGTCTTKCPNDDYNSMVGSFACERCEYNCGRDMENQTVLCSWQKDKLVEVDRLVKYINEELLKPKEVKEMDLTKIAVKFHGSNQREVIRSVFKEKGFKVPEIISIGGFIGYADSCDYVCALTEYGLQDKTIITYEEFIGGKEMKRLDIRKDHKSEKGIVVHCNSDIETVVKLLNDRADVISTILIGKRGVSLKMANDIIKLFNIPYELYEETDWSKVEEGAEVTFRAYAVVDGVNIEDILYVTRCNFHSYIPNLKKVVLIVGNEVKVVDEDKVELV